MPSADECRLSEPVDSSPVGWFSGVLHSHPPGGGGLPRNRDREMCPRKRGAAAQVLAPTGPAWAHRSAPTSLFGQRRLRLRDAAAGGGDEQADEDEHDAAELERRWVLAE